MVIESDRKSPVAVSILSLSLLLPLAAALPGPAGAIVHNAVVQIESKHDVTVATAATPQAFATNAASDGETATRVQTGQQPDATPSGVTPADGTIARDPALAVIVRVDGVGRSVHMRDATVRMLLARENIAVALHDRVKPAIDSALVAGSTIEVTHVKAWLERVLTRIAPPVARKYDVSMLPGTARVVDAGAAGTRESTVAVLRSDTAAAPKRLLLAARVLRLPRMRILAEGVGDGVVLSRIARRGFVGTMNLADAALRMIATAYTANCSGCSGLTASGRPAGHGVVAVDPHIIPLGSHLFIPGYGHAYAGDTGGAIHGNRIDLGFDSNRDARTFGRRPIVVYLFR